MINHILLHEHTEKDISKIKISLNFLLADLKDIIINYLQDEQNIEICVDTLVKVITIDCCTFVIIRNIFESMFCNHNAIIVIHLFENNKLRRINHSGRITFNLNFINCFLISKGEQPLLKTLFKQDNVKYSHVNHNELLIFNKMLDTSVISEPKKSDVSIEPNEAEIYVGTKESVSIFEKSQLNFNKYEDHYLGKQNDNNCEIVSIIDSFKFLRIINFLKILQKKETRYSFGNLPICNLL
jgi:hypothetical protein